MDPRTVVIHVGEGKVGSSTIQRAGLESREALAAAGVVFPLDDVWRTQHAELARELEGRGDTGSVERLRGVLAAHDGVVLLSSEHFARFDVPSIRRLAEVLDGRPAQVAMYLRPYTGWLVSKYAQSTKRGRTMAQWDVFFRRFERASSADRALRWAEVLGPDRVRVRTTHPGDLVGGTLLDDLSRVVGAPLRASADANVSPSWMGVEAARWMALQIGHDADDALRRRSLQRLIALVEPAAAGHPRAQYLTPEQSDELARMWEDDLRRLHDGLGHASPLDDIREPRPRPFQPTAAEIPEAVTAAVAEQLARPRVRKRHAGDDLALFDRFAARDL